MEDGLQRAHRGLTVDDERDRPEKAAEPEALVGIRVEKEAEVGGEEDEHD